MPARGPEHMDPSFPSRPALLDGIDFKMKEKTNKQGLRTNPGSGLTISLYHGVLQLPLQASIPEKYLLHAEEGTEEPAPLQTPPQETFFVSPAHRKPGPSRWLP